MFKGHGVLATAHLILTKRCIKSTKISRCAQFGDEFPFGYAIVSPPRLVRAAEEQPSRTRRRRGNDAQAQAHEVLSRRSCLPSPIRVSGGSGPSFEPAGEKVPRNQRGRSWRSSRALGRSGGVFQQLNACVIGALSFRGQNRRLPSRLRSLGWSINLVGGELAVIGQKRRNGSFIMAPEAVSEGF